MGVVEYKDNCADVICQHCKDGLIIPLKIRITDEDGECQTYQIRGYKILSHPGEIKLPNGIASISNRWSFECKIIIWGMERRIKLFYDSSNGIWRVGGM